MLDIFLSATSLILVIFLSEYQYVLFIILMILLIVLNIIYPKPILFYTICGIGGACAESLAVKYGRKTWKYEETTNLLNIPIWLIPLWAIAGVFIVGVFEKINILKVK
jgi:hypothetical protein